MSIIETALELKRRNETRIKFILIGDGANKRNLMEIAKRNKLENIIFHPPVNKRKLFELFAFADLGIQILANNPSFLFLEPREQVFRLYGSWITSDYKLPKLDFRIN